MTSRESAAQRTSEERALGFAAATSVVVGMVVGIGIFLTPAELVRVLGSPGLVFVMWLVTGVMALAGALAYGELASRFPAAGGTYVYLREAYGGRIAFLYGWNCLLVMDPGLTAAISTGLAGYAAYFHPLSAGSQKAFAITVILALAAVTALGTRLAAGTLVALTLVKLAVLLALVVSGFLSAGSDFTRLFPLFHRAEGSEPLIAGLAGGFVSAFFSFGGWWEASKIAGEVRNPGRTLPLAFALGVALVTMLYVAISTVFLVTVPFEEAASASAFASILGEKVFGPVGGKLLTAIVLVSGLGSLAALMFAAPRLYLALADDGLFPRRLGTRAAATFVQAALGSLLVILGTFGEIVAYFIFATVFFITLSVAALWVLPKEDPRVPFARLGGGIFVALAAVLLIVLLLGRPVPSLAGVAVVALGAVVYESVKRR
ncbi:MAG TPA: amino acid permease [Vicinamibacteria bacterium]